MKLPAILVFPDGARSLFSARSAFADDAGTNHPPEAWDLWTKEDWAAMCPRLKVLPVADPGPSAVPGKRALRNAVDAWILGDDAATVTYTLVPLTPEEIEAAKPPVPASVTNFQARAALLASGLFAQVNDAIHAQPVASPAYQAWEYANEITRGGELVNSMAETLGFTAGQLDDLFRQAATIEA